jgi:hypothetical protein
MATNPEVSLIPTIVRGCSFYLDAFLADQVPSGYRELGPGFSHSNILFSFFFDKDLAWHTHQLNADQYRTDTLSTLGMTPVHHIVPQEPARGVDVTAGAWRVCLCPLPLLVVDLFTHCENRRERSMYRTVCASVVVVHPALLLVRLDRLGT